MNLVLIFVAVLVLTRLVQKYFNLLRSGFEIPGPWFIPFVGNPQVVLDIEPKVLFQFIDKLRQTYQSTFRIFLGTNLWVFLHSTEEVREALNEESLERADTFQKLSFLIGNGLLISEGKHWRNHRRVLTPAFHPTLMSTFMERIYYHSEIFVERVLKKNEVKISHYIFPCMFDTICDTSMGTNLRTQEDDCSPYVEAFHEASELLFKRMSYPLHFNDFIYNLTPSSRRLQKSIDIIHGMTNEIIQKQIENLNSKGYTLDGKYKRTFLQILLTDEIDGKPIPFKDIQDEVNTFLFAGVDTTAAALTFVLYCLGKYPEWQEKLFQEISSDSDIHPNVSDMKNLDMFIKECLRFYTIVPLTGRQVTKDIKIGNTKIYKGTTLWINMYGLAHDEKYFPEPYTFNPDRFGDEAPKISPYAFLPFSGGAHSCIGKKYAMFIMKILITKTLMMAKVSLKNPTEKIDLMAEMVLKPVNEINLIFERRI